MKTPRPRSRMHIDEEKVREKERVKRDLRDLLDKGDEEGYVAMLKALRPSITPEELVHLVHQFRAERLNQSRGV